MGRAMRAAAYAGYALLVYAACVVGLYPYASTAERLLLEHAPVGLQLRGLSATPWRVSGEALTVPLPDRAPLVLRDWRLVPRWSAYGEAARSSACPTTLAVASTCTAPVVSSTAIHWLNWSLSEAWLLIITAVDQEAPPLVERENQIRVLQVEETFEPYVAETPAPTRYGEVEAGRTEGFTQRAVGMVGGRARIQLELVLHLRPHSASLEPSDSIEIDGLHPVRLTLKPGMDAILATSAQLVNAIPVVLAATPGLKSVKDLPPTTAWLGDLTGGVIR